MFGFVGQISEPSIQQVCLSAETIEFHGMDKRTRPISQERNPFWLRRRSWAEARSLRRSVSRSKFFVYISPVAQDDPVSRKDKLERFLQP